MINNVIVFTGRKQSGKDYMCKSIKEDYPNIIQLSFGSELKKIASMVYDWCDFSDDIKDEIIWTPHFTGTKRDVIFTVDKLKAIDKTVFFRLWLKNQFSIAVENPHKLFIITDMRFQYELDFIKKMGFPIIKIIRADRSNILGSEDNVEYERWIDSIECDYEFTNDLTKLSVVKFRELFFSVVRDKKLMYLL